MGEHREKCGPDVKMHHCYKCDFKCPNVQYLGRHLNQVHGKNTKCEKCDYRTDKTQDMRRHEQRCYKLESYTNKCDFCDYKTFSKTQMKRHIQKCQSEKLYKCTKCDFKASSETLVTLHITKEHGRVNKCSYCPYEHECHRTVRKHEKRCKGWEATCFKCNTTFSQWSYQRHHKTCNPTYLEPNNKAKGQWIVKLTRLNL